MTRGAALGCSDKTERLDWCCAHTEQKRTTEVSHALISSCWKSCL